VVARAIASSCVERDAASDDFRIPGFARHPGTVIPHDARFAIATEYCRAPWWYRHALPQRLGPVTTVLQPQRTDRPFQAPVERPDPGRFRTTPGRLRLLSLVSVAAILVLLVVSAGALSSRRSAANSVRNDSGPLLVQVQDLYRRLADADASASRSLLETGGVSIQILEQYEADLEAGGQLLAAISDHPLSAEARAAVAVLAQEIPNYSAEVESARVQTRAGHPVGAQHMRDASELMRRTILPATLVLYTSAADELHSDYERGTSASQMVWIVVIGIATLAVLVVAQFYTARRTNRVFNVGLLVASVIVAVLLVWTLVRFSGEQNALVRAQRDGSDSVQLLSSARILALGAQSNANIALAERGTGGAYRAEFDRLMKLLCQNRDCAGGLLADAYDVADRTDSTSNIAGIQEAAAAFWSEADAVVELDDKGEFVAAVDRAVDDAGQAGAASALDASIVEESRNAQERFDAAARDARSGFAVLAVALVLGLLLAAVLVLVGLQPRIQEYR
jgi:hypothetical protein